MYLDFLHLTLRVILVFIFGYCLYQGYDLVKKLHGGRFTSVLPPLIGAIALLFTIQGLILVFGSIRISADSLTLATYSIQVMYIISGILLIKAIYQLYQIGFATSGFFGGK